MQKSRAKTQNPKTRVFPRSKKPKTLVIGQVMFVELSSIPHHAQMFLLQKSVKLAVTVAVNFSSELVQSPQYMYMYIYTVKINAEFVHAIHFVIRSKNSKKNTKKHYKNIKKSYCYISALQK